MDSLFDTGKSGRMVHETHVAHSHRCKAHQAVQDGNQLGHLGHLHATREHDSDAAAYQQGDHQDYVILGYDPKHRGEQCDCHAADAIPVAATRSLLVGKAAQGQDKQNRRSDIRHSYNATTNHVVLTF